MATTQKWKATSWGRIIVFVGGLRFAVPVMVLVAIALGIGTFVDAAQGAKVASRLVYGSWWFVALMALIAASLIFAVLTRYPWKQRHIGFITVHAGLVILIAGGFWSLFGRVEGTLKLGEGMSGNAIELDKEQVDLVSFQNGSPHVVASAIVHDNTDAITLGDHTITIVDHWPNITEESYVADDGPEPMRALEIVFDSAAGTTQWIGQASKSGGPAFIDGMTLRVLGEGEIASPPVASTSAGPGYAFVFGDERYPLGKPDDQALPGWRVVSLSYFDSAQVGTGGLTEAGGGRTNPAVEVIITDNAGTVERHTAFLNFPEMVLARTVEGSSESGAILAVTGGAGELLVIHSGNAPRRATYTSADGVTSEFDHAGPLPWILHAGTHHLRIVNEVSRARMATRFIEAPPADDYRPALLVQVAGSAAQPLPWKGSLSFDESAGLTLRFGPPQIALPFTVHLQDFRKTDYPGTTMAMAYESEITVDASSGESRSQIVSMNKPLADSGWKVYQSGFVNDNVSIFSVMKDPGLPLTYLGCTVLCIGIVITFYSRGLSWGHPGVARALVHEERSNESPIHHCVCADDPAAVSTDEHRANAGRVIPHASQEHCNSGCRPGDAARHIRTQSRSAVDGAIKVVR